MNILDYVKKVPGGLMLVTLVIASVCNTFFPSLFRIGDPMRAFTTKEGTMVMITMFLVYTGIHFEPQVVATCLKRGGKLIGFKYGISIITSLFYIQYFGMPGRAGISSVALVTTLMTTNPGLYIALMEGYGDEADKANFAILAVIALPFVPICVLGYAEGASIDYNSIIATLLPVLAGFILGQLDPEIKKFTKQGLSLLLPFFGFALGSSINLSSAFTSLMSGSLLFMAFVIFNTLPTIAFDQKVLKQKGHAAAALCSMGGTALVVPSMMVDINPLYQPYVESAVAQLVLVMLFGMIVSPILTKRIVAGKKICRQKKMLQGSN